MKIRLHPPRPYRREISGLTETEHRLGVLEDHGDLGPVWHRAVELYGKLIYLIIVPCEPFTSQVMDSYGV